MADKNIIDEYGSWELFTEMHSYFGTRRMVEVFGYLVVLGMTTNPKWETPRIVDRMVSLGFSRAGSYRVIADVKAFKNNLEEKRGYTIPMSEIFAEFDPENLKLVKSRMRDDSEV